MKALTVTKLIAIARDLDVTPEKLNAIIAYNSQVAVEQSIRAFHRDYRRLQAALPIIEKNETITFKDGRTGTYAPNDEIQELIGPILREHGFSLSFTVTFPPHHVKVVGELTHKDGHTKTSEYEARVDFSGGKTDTQGRGSVISYGQRYCTVPLLNLIQRGHDVDGAVAQAPVDDTPKPDGYARFLRDLWDGANAGSSALGAVWGGATVALRDAVPQATWNELKMMAGKADAVI